MKIRSLTPSMAGAMLLAAAGTAHAQFLTTITKPVFGVNAPEMYLTDVAAGTNTLVFDIESLGLPATAPGIGGLAGDDANNRFFASIRNGPNDDIYEFSYSNLTTPTKLVETFGSIGQDVAIDGLAYDSLRGVLYATRSLGSAGEAEGLFTIDLTTGVLTNVVVYETTATSIFTINGIDYDADTDTIYLIDEDDTQGRWIYTFDPANPAGGITQLVALPAGVTDVDGLGAGGGKLFLVTDNANANGGVHYIYDIASGTFSTQASPYPAPAGSPIAPNPSAGGAYVPGLNLGAECVGDIADDFGTLGADGEVSFGDFLALLGLIGPCDGGTPGCTGDIADDFGTIGADAQVSFGDFLALLGLIGPCP